MCFVYEDGDTLWQKVEAVAKKMYSAAEVTTDTKVRAQLRQLQDQGYGHYPVCIAKTQYSFSTDPQLRGAPSGHPLNVCEVRLAAGAEFVVLICGASSRCGVCLRSHRQRRSTSTTMAALSDCSDN